MQSIIAAVTPPVRCFPRIQTERRMFRLKEAQAMPSMRSHLMDGVELAIHRFCARPTFAGRARGRSIPQFIGAPCIARKRPECIRQRANRVTVGIQSLTLSQVLWCKSQSSSAGRIPKKVRERSGLTPWALPSTPRPRRRPRKTNKLPPRSPVVGECRHVAADHCRGA